MVNRPISMDKDGAWVCGPCIVNFKCGVVVVDNEFTIHIKMCVTPPPVDRGDRRAAPARIAHGMAVRIVETSGKGQVIAVEDRMDARHLP